LGHRFANALIDRPAAGGGPHHGVDAAGTTELDTEEALQAAGRLVTPGRPRSDGSANKGRSFCMARSI
jgi:hypothetical protein